jgi:hypothetical protein
LSLTGAIDAAAATPPGLAQRIDRIACGNTVVIAHAYCYEATAACIRETLTFHRPESRAVLAPHKHMVPQLLPDGSAVEGLDYRISRWACVPGINGGRYVAVIMTRTNDTNCNTCEYLRLYHPNGRLIAATLTFDAGGTPREDRRAMELLGNTIERPRADVFRRAYTQ